MKRLALILLLVLFLFYTMGYIACLYLMKFEHRQNIKRQIACGNYTETTLVKISSAKSYEVAYLNDDEILFENHMYDVLKSYEKEGDIYFVCLSDEEETSIMYALRDYAEEESGPEGKRVQGMLLKLAHFVFDFQINDLFVVSENYVLNYYLLLSSPKTISLPLVMDAPPPDHAHSVFLRL